MPALIWCSAIGVQSTKPLERRRTRQDLLSARSSILRPALLTFGGTCQRCYPLTYAFRRLCDLQFRICQRSDLLARTAVEMTLIPALSKIALQRTRSASLR